MESDNLGYWRVLGVRQVHSHFGTCFSHTSLLFTVYGISTNPVRFTLFSKEVYIDLMFHPVSQTIP